jgi:Transposase
MACRYAGIDWASQTHDVLVADEMGEELLSATYAHDEKGLTALCRVLVRLEVVLVAIERPDGLLVDRLLDAGLRVLALHPNKVAAARDRLRVSGGKSDRFDAPPRPGCGLARSRSARVQSGQRARSQDPADILCKRREAGIALLALNVLLAWTRAHLREGAVPTRLVWIPWRDHEVAPADRLEKSPQGSAARPRLAQPGPRPSTGSS